MRAKEALEILEIYDKDPSESVIKKGYHKQALKYHPDKNREPEAQARFLKIQEAYETLMGSPQEKEYSSILQSFMDSFFGGDSYILERIMKICDEKCEDVLRKMDKHVLKNIYNMLLVHKDTLHLSSELLEKISQVLKEKFACDEVYILHPLLNDLFDDNLYKLVVGKDVFFIPLWHHHLVYSINDLKEIFVDCYPILPDHIEIDEMNHIHVRIYEKMDELWRKPFIHIPIGNREFSIKKGELKMLEYQQYIFYNEGISAIQTKNVYDVSKRSHIVVHLYIE